MSSPDNVVTEATLARSSGGAVAVLQIAVPMLAGLSLIVFRGNAADINNPELPLWFSLSKDVAFALLVFVPFLVGVFTGGLKVSPPVVMYGLYAIWLGALMLLIAEVKFSAAYVPLGKIRNIAFYYVGGGMMAVLAAARGYEMRLFALFRAFMAFSIALGISFYIFADNILHYTIHRRLIGTLVNPNFVGFLCFVWIVLIHARVLHRQRFGIWSALELLTAIIGMGLAASFAGILATGLWWLILMLLIVTGLVPKNTALVRLVAAEAALGLIGVTTILTLVQRFTSGIVVIVGRVSSLLFAFGDTTAVRFQSYLQTFEGMSTLSGLLLGQWRTSEFVPFDGTNPAVLYNFGLPYFLLWTAYFLLPIILALRAWPRLTRRKNACDCVALMMTPCLLITFGVVGWLQFIPESYPPCVILSWIMFFVLIQSLSSTATQAGGAAEAPASR